MFGFLKRKSKTNLPAQYNDDNENERLEKNSEKAVTAAVTADVAQAHAAQAAKTFAKPSTYSREVREILDNGAMKRAVKENAFKGGTVVRDPYTNDEIMLRQADAKMKYGADWQNHVAEADHITPLKQVYDKHSGDAWNTINDIRNEANSYDNMEAVSRKFNNAKRQRYNSDLVNDPEYLENKGVNITEDGRKLAIESDKRARAAVDKNLRMSAAKNFADTWHNAGKATAQKSAGMTATMSGIMNITAVINGDKSVEEALVDTAEDTGKAAATGYLMGGGLTTISHTLSSSKSDFLKALNNANVPAKIITAVMVTGDTIVRFGRGEITTQECIIELGERGLSLATVSYSMAVGGVLIPIPIVGEAVGALVGSILTSNLYHQLINKLQMKELEHQERLRVIAECEAAAEQARAYRAELEAYLEEYFRDYQQCFDEALSEISYSLKVGDADGVVAGANMITQKLGGQVKYSNMDEFRDFLNDDSTDIL